jgi:septum formation protein
MRLVLASKSAARARILRDAGVIFELRSAGVDETPVKADAVAKGAGPRRVAEILAGAKAIAASNGSLDLVIGADQTLEFDERLFDKAKNLDQAREDLKRLRGKTHRLHSAVALAQDGHLIWHDVQSVSLTMRAFSDNFLEGYLSRNAETALFCVGGYALEGEGVQLFSAIDGDYFAVLGLPILPLLAELRRLEVVPA